MLVQSFTRDITTKDPIQIIPPHWEAFDPQKLDHARHEST